MTKEILPAKKLLGSIALLLLLVAPKQGLSQQDFVIQLEGRGQDRKLAFRPRLNSVVEADLENGDPKIIVNG